MIKKRGMSEVVSTVLIIALVIAAVGIVWAVVANFIDDSISETGTCFEASTEVAINNRYTCFNSSTQELRFSIDIGNVDIKEVLVSVSSFGSSTSFKINVTGSQIPYVVMYPSRSTNVTLPKKNAGFTYLFNMSAAGYPQLPDSIQIAPLSGKEQCEVSDSLERIDNCLSVIN